MTRTAPLPSGAQYLDVEAAIGISKHLGGPEASRELLSLCHAERAGSVLDVGCGIGVGPATTARTLRCRTVGVDLSPRMIGWARGRALEEGVEDLVDLCAADVLALPFPDGRFDVVMCESVLAFVEDKAAAIRECVRVTRPGGYVGLNEAVWLEEPPGRMVQLVRDTLGPSIPDDEGWRRLWAASGLEDRLVRTHPLQPGPEIWSRIRWIGWRWLGRGWVRAARLCVTDPAVRRSLRQQLRVPMDVFDYLGYGYYVGRKPVRPGL